MLTVFRFNLWFALLGAFAAIFLRPCSASAKLGENLPALIKRFGSNYHSLPLGRWAEAAYEFETKNLTVDVFLVKGVSVSECYFSDHALVNGAPSESIWSAVRKKNAPNAKWMVNGDNGFVSTDNRYTTWFDTKGIPAQYTYALGINDQIALRGDVPVPPFPSRARVQAKETNLASLAPPVAKLRIGDYAGGNYDPTKYVYSYPYFQIAESSQAKRVYAARSYTRADCKVYDYPGNFVSLEAGEPLHVLSVDPETYSLTVLRTQFNTIAHLSQDCVTVR